MPGRETSARVGLSCFCLLAAIVGGGLVARGDAPDSPPRPNILVIVSDDQGFGDLGCYGNSHVKTPALDRLAAQGARLTSFYVTWPACTPSRASLLTGRYPQRHGLYDMIRNEAPDYGKRYTEEEYAVTFERIGGLDTREVMVSQLLSDAGFACGVVGKWDLGMHKRFLPLSRGFDSFYGFVNTGIDYFTHERYGVPSMYEGLQPTEAERGEYATWLFERKAADFIQQNSDRPFFLYLAFNAPHSASNLDPKIRGMAQAPPALQEIYPDLPRTYATGEMYGRRVERPTSAHRRLNHMAALTGMDRSIGRLVDLLAELEIEDRTVVIFLSDNGAGGGGDNGVLRGGKGDVWEGGIRVPCIIRIPDVIPAGTTSDAFLSSLEIVPTVVNLAGVSLPDYKLDGTDMLPVLTGERSSVRERMFWRRRDLCAGRVGAWKWVQTPSGGGLFNLKEDPGETNDLSAAHPRKRDELATAFRAWQEAMQAAPPRRPFRDY